VRRTFRSPTRGSACWTKAIRDQPAIQWEEQALEVLHDRAQGLIKDPCRVMTDAALIAADSSLDLLIHNDPEQARVEADSQRRRRGMLDPWKRPD